MPNLLPTLDRDPPDSGDRAAFEQETHRQIALQRQRDLAELTEPQDIDADGQVHCLDCAAIIPPERLAIMPTTARCVGCEDALETKQQQATGRRR